MPPDVSVYLCLVYWCIMLCSELLLTPLTTGSLPTPFTWITSSKPKTKKLHRYIHCAIMWSISTCFLYEHFSCTYKQKFRFQLYDMCPSRGLLGCFIRRRWVFFLAQGWLYNAITLQDLGGIFFCTITRLCSKDTLENKHQRRSAHVQHASIVPSQFRSVRANRRAEKHV